MTDTLIEMGSLAASGDEAYQEKFEAFRQRHIDAVDELLRGEYKDMVLPELERSSEVLKNLLYGIFWCGKPRSGRWIMC